MQRNDLFDDGKTYAVALGGMRGVRLVKFAEDARNVLGGNYLARVGDRNRDFASLILDRDTDDTVLVRKFDGVVDQVDPYLLEKLLARNDVVLLKINIEGYVSLRPFSFQKKDGRSDLLL